MIHHRERPRCRQAILEILKQENIMLEELLNHPTIFLSNGLKSQAKKMLQEGQFRTGLQIYQNMEKGEYPVIWELIK